MRHLATIAAAIAAALPLKGPDRPADRHHCDKSYARTSALAGVRANMHAPWLTGRRGARAWRFVHCTRTRRSERIVRRELLRLRAWRRSYGGYWQIQRARLSSATVAMLNRLGGCETRGIPYPANYRNHGHHDGRYQYNPGTWQRAEAAFPGRVVGWTAAAHVASPAHQDAVTAYFFPAHRGEWACSA